MKKEISRRSMLKIGLGTAALTTGASSMAANACGVSAAQTSGPFPPTEAMDEVRGQQNPGAKIEIADRDEDLTQIAGQTTAAIGQVIVLTGEVVDQDCKPVPGAVVHMWQADDNGHYNHQNDSSTADPSELDSGFQYSTILRTDGQGQFSLKTIVPKYYGIGGGLSRTAHLHFLVRKLGYDTLITQSYFEGEALEEIDRIRELNANDIILSPRGEIRSELENLIVDFQVNASGVPEGHLTLSMRKF